VTEVGEVLERLDPMLYSEPVSAPEVCILYDWESRWAVEYAQTGLSHGMKYHDTVLAHYHAFWELGIPVDFRDMRDVTDLSRYRIVIAPQLFMFRGGIEQKLEQFVRGGGTLVMTYFSGIVDEHNLAFLSDAPHDLTHVLGVREAEMDALFPDESNAAVTGDGTVYPVSGICSLLELEGAEAVASYRDDSYQGTPAITRNAYGSGEAWYLGARLTGESLDAFYAHITQTLGIARAIDADLPHGVTAHARGSVVFLENYSGKDQTVLPEGNWMDVLRHLPFDGHLPAGTVRILTRGA
jgi:beta-galactosidase